MGSRGQTNEDSTIQDQKLTAEEMYTILTEVEAILNSRPLVPLDSAPIDGAQVLTPGHFLVGRSLKALPQTIDTTTKITSLRRWNLCKRLAQDLWEKWSQDYLQLLQKFQRWKYPKRSVQVGDVVLLKDSELFLCSWALAVVELVHPGRDGLVRVGPPRDSTSVPSLGWFRYWIKSRRQLPRPRRMFRSENLPQGQLTYTN